MTFFEFIIHHYSQAQQLRSHNYFVSLPTVWNDNN